LTLPLHGAHHANWSLQSTNSLLMNSVLKSTSTSAMSMRARTLPKNVESRPCQLSNSTRVAPKSTRSEVLTSTASKPRSKSWNETIFKFWNGNHCCKDEHWKERVNLVDTIYSIHRILWSPIKFTKTTIFSFFFQFLHILPFGAEQIHDYKLKKYILYWIWRDYYQN